MTDPADRKPEYLKDRGGCLWWLVILTTMLAGCVGSAALIESMATVCSDMNFSQECAGHVIDNLSQNPPPPRSGD